MRGETLRKSKEISPQFLRECLHDICKIGVKYAGTPGEIKARDYIFDKLKDFGLGDVRLEEFEYLNYMPITAELSIASEEQLIACEPLQHSANAVVEGELVYAGTSKEELDALVARGVSLKGKIALVKTPFPFWVYPTAEKLGVTGFVVITDPPDNLIRVATAVADRRKGTIPGVTISLKDGERLLELLKKQKVKVHLESRGEYREKKSWNIIGEVRGNESPEQKVVVCSHYDSQIKGQHAWDNVSGDAGLLEIARVMANSHPRRTITIVFFGVEEQGAFWGSTAYVWAHRDDMKNYRVLINLDGFSSALCPQNFLETTTEVREYSMSVAKKLNWSVHHSGNPMPLSDHVPFIKAGVSAIWVHEGLVDPYYHTERDVFEHINIDKLSKITEVAATYVTGLANLNRLANK